MMLPAIATIPVALAIGLILLWYWAHLASANYPSSRRRIRRASVVLMFVSLPFFVRAISFLNHTSQPTQFVVTWILAIFLLFLVVVTAGIDIFNSMKLQHDRQIDEAAQDIAAMIKASREKEGQSEQEDDDS